MSGHPYAVADQERGFEGERLTLERVFRTFLQDVHRMVRSLLGPTEPEDEVEEVVQLVFIAIDRALPRFRGDSALSTWVYGITSRVVLRHLRSRRRYRAMIERFEHSTCLDTAPVGVEETVAARQSLRLVWGLLLRMRPDWRILIVLHEIEHLSLKEIAVRLELSEDAVRSRLRRARAELKAGFETTKRREGEPCAVAMT